MITVRLFVKPLHKKHLKKKNTCISACNHDHS